MFSKNYRISDTIVGHVVCISRSATDASSDGKTNFSDTDGMYTLQGSEHE